MKESTFKKFFVTIAVLAVLVTGAVVVVAAHFLSKVW